MHQYGIDEKIREELCGKLHMNDEALYNREALSMAYDYATMSSEEKNIQNEYANIIINNESVYSYFRKIVEQNKKDTSNVEGIWIKYNQGEDPKVLVDGVSGRGTGWFTAGYKVAKLELNFGDFYVYYTKDSKGEYKQPRIGIRMDGKEKIDVIRGISEYQNLEPEMEKILEEKLAEFSDNAIYKKKLMDAEKLTTIYNEHTSRELTKEELGFIYEIDNKIGNFGYMPDPRIKGILEKIDLKKDLSRCFSCSEHKISIKKEDIMKYDRIKFHYGDLYIFQEMVDLGITLPERISGSLFSNNLTDIRGLVLPKKIDGSLYLNKLISADGLDFPENIKGTLDLGGLVSAEGLVLPKNINESLYLNGLTIAKELKLPESIGGSLFLESLATVEGLIPPKYIGGRIFLNDLVRIDNLTLPESFKNKVYFL